MNRKILITYASRAGSTAEIAEAIGKTLRRDDNQVDVLPMQSVTELVSYQAVVVGSAIRKSQWLPEAMEFVRSHQAELNGKPVAMFTVCITLAMRNGNRYLPTVKEWIQPARQLIQPVGEGTFAGRLDFRKLPITFDTLLLRLTVALGIFPGDDRRDWTAINAWAEVIRPLLAG
jgi:menaquinone-dependent protoporphyrinogen oxidase